jgi:hypothetical protein
VLAQVRQAEDTEAALRAWGADFGLIGVYRQHGASTFVVRVSQDRYTEAVSANAGIRWAGTVEIRAGRAGKKAVDATQKHLIRRVEGRTKSTFAFYYDVQRDVIMLTSDAPPQEIDALLLGVTSPVEYRRGRYREQDGSGKRSIIGGVALENITTHQRCTAGLVVIRDGARRILTAGHCGMLGDTLLLSEQYRGHIAERVPFGERDAALVACSCITELDGPVLGGRSAGRVDGTTRFIAGQSDVYTHGSTTGELGGHEISSVNATVCAGRCRSGMIAYRGAGVSADGDSGMPLYLRSGKAVLVGGIHSGAITETGEMFGETWATISDALFVTLE